MADYAGPAVDRLRDHLRESMQRQVQEDPQTQEMARAAYIEQLQKGNVAGGVSLRAKEDKEDDGIFSFFTNPLGGWR